MGKKRGLKLSTNLQQQRTPAKSQILKENEELRWVDYDALTIKDAYCKENMAGERQVTPGKALFSLSHSHKKKSAAWMTMDEGDEESDQENALPEGSPLGKRRAPLRDKGLSVPNLKEPRSCPPAKRIKEILVKSCQPEIIRETRVCIH